MRGKNKLIFIFFLSNFLILNAQQEVLISLDDVLSKAVEKNYTIKISEEDVNAPRLNTTKQNRFFYQTSTLPILELLLLTH